MNWAWPLKPFLVACALGGLLAACGGQTEGVLIPNAGRAPGASTVDMLVATTRLPDTTTPGVMFGGARALDINFADIAVSIPPTHKAGDIEWPSSPPGDPAREFTTERADILSREAALARFDKRVRKAPSRRVLVFVHGFNTKFEDAVYRFAQIVHDSGVPAAPVLFTWPSQGRVFAYGYDRESSSYSRDGLEALLQSLIDDRNVGEIDVLAHSMGNVAALEALRQLAIRKGRISPKIQNVMLASPDVDFDIFRRQIGAMGPKKPAITLFVSRDDKALAVSRRVWGDKVRVGAIDPRAEPYRSVLEQDDIIVADLTNIKTDDGFDHSKFAESPLVVRAIGRRLAQGQPLEDGQTTLADKVGQLAVGTVSGVGSAAGAVVSAPFAVFDPRARDNLMDHVQNAGTNLMSTVGAVVPK